MRTHRYTLAQYHKQKYVMHVRNYIQLDTWLNLLQKSIDILSKNTSGVKKGKAKSEAPKVILFIYSIKKIDIM